MRDTLEFMPRTIGIGISTPVAVRIVNDSSLVSFNLKLIAQTVDGGFARCDSITYAGSFSDPSILPLRIVNLDSVNGLSPDKMVFAFIRLAGNILPPGNDTLLNLYFTGIRPGIFSLDTTKVATTLGIYFSHESPFSDYRPVTEEVFFEVVEVEQPPELTVSSASPIVATGSNKFEVDISAKSFTVRPVTISLASFTGFDDAARSPASMPVLSKANPALLNWTPGPSDVGIWLATFQASDSTGLTSFATATLQVVSDESFLVTFNVTDADSAVQGTGIIHGNLDGDRFPELFVPAIGFQSISTYGVYDYEQASLIEIDRVSTGRPGKGGVLGYLDRDNNLDAVISQRGHPVLMLGSKNDGFSMPETPQSDGSSACRTATLADINGDQYLDYVMVRESSGEVDIYIGSGDGFTFYQQVTTQEIALSINSADFDGDNRDDLAIGTEAGLEIYLNRGGAGFMLSAKYDQEFGSLDIEVTNQGSDFNNDNLFDLALATPSVGGDASELMIYSGNGDGTFEQSQARLVQGQIFANCAGDFNNDGQLDIAYINGTHRYLAIAFGNGQGEFPDEVRYDIPKYVPFQLDCLDIDLDGDLDIVVNSFKVGLATSLFLYRNNSDPSDVHQRTVEISARNNASIELTSPSGSRLNRVVKSISSGEYYRRSLDDDNNIDATAIINTIESGPYELSVLPKQNLSVHDPFTLEYLIDGEKYRLADNIPMPISGLQYTIYPDGNSPIVPTAGQFVDDPQPVFSWPSGEAQLFELATDREFTNVIVSDTISGGVYVSQENLPFSDSAQYFWRASSLSSGIMGKTFVFNSTAIVTDIGSEDDDDILPGNFQLGQNYPNPFNPSTVIEFELAHASPVLLTIHNVLGQLITTLVNRELSAGTHTVQWIPTDGVSESPASGIYFYRIEASEFVATKKMVYIR